MGELGRAIDTMGREVLTKQAELERQKERYRDLFEHVPAPSRSRTKTCGF
jgi:histidine kinase